MKKTFLSVFLMVAFLVSYSRPLIQPSNVSNNGNPVLPIANVKLFDLFKSMDQEILKSNDESKVQGYLIKKNSEIRTYLAQTYPKRDAESLDINDPDFTGIALLFAMLELNNFETTVQRQMPAWLACAGGVVGTIFGVDGIVEEFASIVSGNASFSTTWALVKKIIRRYAGWLGVAYAVYEVVTECF